MDKLSFPEATHELTGVKDLLAKLLPTDKECPWLLEHVQVDFILPYLTLSQYIGLEIHPHPMVVGHESEKTLCMSFSLANSINLTEI